MERKATGMAGEATWVHCVLAGVTGHGQALSYDWPYANPHFTAGPPAAAADPARRRRCGPSQAATACSVEDIARLLLAGHAPIITVAFVPATWAAGATDGWVDDPAPPVRGAHAVLGVGCVRATGEHPDAVIFKNSWSERWGQQGYGLLSERYLAAHHQHTDILKASIS